MPNEFWMEIERKSNKNEDAVNAELKAAYATSLKEIQGRIEKFMTDNPDMSYVKAMQLSQMKSLENQIKTALQSLNGMVQDIASQQQMKELEYGYFGEWYNIEDQLGMSVSFGQLSEEKIRTLARSGHQGIPLSERLYGSVLEDTQVAIKNVLKEGLIGGYDNRRMARRLQDEAAVSYRKAKTIVRTESGRINSLARQEAQDNAADLGILLEKRWIATLDKKTRTSHAMLDGQVVGKDEEFTLYDGSKGMQPRMFGIAGEDINCRCGCVSVVDGFSSDRRRDGITKKLVKTKDYESWLKENHPDEHKAFQKAAGDVKAKARAKTPATPPKAATGTRDAAEKQLNELTQKKYANMIGRSELDASDYAKLKASGKFDEKLGYWQGAINAPQFYKPAITAKAPEKIRELKEFEANGKRYQALKAELEDIRKKMAALPGSSPATKTPAPRPTAEEQKAAYEKNMATLAKQESAAKAAAAKVAKEAAEKAAAEAVAKALRAKAPLPSLARLKAHTEKFMAPHLKALEKFVKKTEIPKLQEALETIVNKSDFLMRVDANTLRKIQRSDGLLKSSVELGEGFSSGYDDPEFRAEVAEHMFGFKPGEVAKNGYEKYGYLGTLDGTADKFSEASGYGEVTLKFKKAEVWDRTTFTYGDSLDSITNDNLIGARINDPTAYLAGLPDDYAEELLTAANRHKSGLDAYNAGAGYIEAQYHGELGLDNLEAVVFNLKTDLITHPRNLIESLQDSGVKVYYRDGSGKLIEVE